MKKLIITLSLFIITLIILHFSTMKQIQESTLPVSSITNMNINTTSINYDGHIIKAPYNKDFIFINSTETNEGHPDGTFTLIKSKSIFGFVSYKTSYNNPN